MRQDSTALGRRKKEGSLTSSAKKVFLADVQMKVVDTKIAVLDMDFLLGPVAHFIDISLALMRGVSSHTGVLCHFRRNRAAVDAMSGSWQRGRRRRSGAVYAHHRVARVRRELGWTLRCLRVTGHDGLRMRGCGDVGWADTKILARRSLWSRVATWTKRRPVREESQTSDSAIKTAVKRRSRSAIDAGVRIVTRAVGGVTRWS